MQLRFGGLEPSRLDDCPLQNACINLFVGMSFAMFFFFFQHLLDGVYRLCGLLSYFDGEPEMEERTCWFGTGQAVYLIVQRGCKSFS